MNQKGFTPIIIVLGILLVVVFVGGAYYFGSQSTQKQEINQISQQSTDIQTPQATPTMVPSSPTTQVISDSKTSPTGEYIITEETVGDGQTITIKDSKGKVLTENVISQNEKEIGYNTKIKCQCGTSFKGWVDNIHFSIKIVNGGGEEYEYLVNATTGKVDETTFRRIK